jgi:fatty-acyl-CoA synthase
VILVDEMPKTGIDKIFKPALRFDAIKRTYENRTAENPAIRVAAEVDVVSDPSVGALADVHLHGEKSTEQQALVASSLKHVTTRYSVAWIDDRSPSPVWLPGRRTVRELPHSNSSDSIGFS